MYFDQALICSEMQPMFERRTPEITQSLKMTNFSALRDDDISFVILDLLTL